MPDQHQQMIEVSDPAHVDAARRAAVRLAERVRADEQWLGRITVVTQELARNLVLHAGGGSVLLSLDRHGLDLVAVDKGPGMANIAQCLSDSYSTAGTMGAGISGADMTGTTGIAADCCLSLLLAAHRAYKVILYKI